MPITLATQKAEIRRITVWSQTGEILCKTLSWKKKSQQRAGGVVQGVGLEFKPHNRKRKKKEVLWITCFRLYYKCISSLISTIEHRDNVLDKTSLGALVMPTIGSFSSKPRICKAPWIILPQIPL
jgi:hypothetical protein